MPAEPPTMGARDEVVAAQGLAHPDRHGLLAHVEVGQTRHLRALVQFAHLLLEGPNLRHLAVHVEVLLQLHPRLDRLSRHGLLLRLMGYSAPPTVHHEAGGFGLEPEPTARMPASLRRPRVSRMGARAPGAIHFPPRSW